jgi:putative transposase
LYEHMSGIISHLKGIVYEIGGIEDHVHILFEIPKNQALSNVIRDVKVSATQWLKEVPKYYDFEWQTGYGAFSVSLSQMNVVKNYIQNQEEHHKKSTFAEEYELILTKKTLG